MDPQIITATKHFVFPSVQDINGGVSLMGRTVLEKSLKDIAAGYDGIISGFDLPGAGTSVSNWPFNGRAEIGGYLVANNYSGSEGLVITFDRSPAFVWLQILLTVDGHADQFRVIIQDWVTPVPDYPCLYVGYIKSSGGLVTAKYQSATAGRNHSGTSHPALSYSGLHVVPCSAPHGAKPRLISAHAPAMNSYMLRSDVFTYTTGSLSITDVQPGYFTVNNETNVSFVIHD